MVFGLVLHTAQSALEHGLCFAMRNEPVAQNESPSDQRESTDEVKGTPALSLNLGPLIVERGGADRFDASARRTLYSSLERFQAHVNPFQSSLPAKPSVPYLPLSSHKSVT